MYLKLPHEEGKETEKLTIEGEIRSIVPWKGGNNRFGVKFISMDKTASTAIGNFIEKYERRSEQRLDLEKP